VNGPLARLDDVNAAAPQEHDVVCPHCKKRFTASLLPGAAAERYRGFKCPHCKLFVPAKRAASTR
jgi:DNA-directed RNA polymerase subunit RPC12/RpoP